jgi:hypothetical protein
MQHLELDMITENSGAFILFDNGVKVGKMDISITGKILTAIHTEVFAGSEGKGFAKLIFNEMLTYVRQHNMMVIPLCPYVLLQFKKDRELYRDIWKKGSATSSQDL